LATYAGLIESARANNRQGFPLGGAYLRQASALLRDQILPALTDVAVTNQNRVRSSYNSDSRVTLLWVGGLLALAALLISQFWLASRMRRWFNLPLLIATAIVAGLLAIGGVATWYAGGKADDVRAGPYRAAVALTAARSDAFDAKSAESLTLINRGSGEVYETRFQAVVVDAESKLQVAVDAGAANGAQRDLTTYLNVHDQVRKLDNGGQWDDAVKLATGTAAQGSNNRFAIFAASSGKALTDQINHVNDDLSSARRPLVVLQWVVLLGGLVAAVAAWRGLAVRLQEYR
ncbi:MAG: hypothetical protein JWL70_636, partial [Acidimicrobiia bacterium]|nr:hypothetical protein [Acidimicrobiia bacterium]